jgi:hypothetical protein
MKTIHLILFAIAALLLCSCHGVGAGPIIGGIAGGIAVLDQLLAGGVIDPIQHHQLATALQSAGTLAEQAVNVAQQAQSAAQHAKDGTLSTEEGVGVAAGITGLAVAVNNAYRNYTRRHGQVATVTHTAA